MCGKNTNFASAKSQGEVLEWLKRHAWKACNRQKRFGGSNPPLSAEILFHDEKTDDPLLDDWFALYPANRSGPKQRS